MALTADQLSDFQKDLGIGSGGDVLTDDELNRFYSRTSSNYEKAMVLALRQILTSAAKFHDYAIGDTKRSKSQVFDHLKEMYGIWQQAAGGGTPLVAGTIVQDFIEPGGTASEYT